MIAIEDGTECYRKSNLYLFNLRVLFKITGLNEISHSFRQASAKTRLSLIHFH